MQLKLMLLISKYKTFYTYPHCNGLFRMLLFFLRGGHLHISYAHQYINLVNAILKIQVMPLCPGPKPFFHNIRISIQGMIHSPCPLFHVFNPLEFISIYSYVPRPASFVHFSGSSNIVHFDIPIVLGTNTLYLSMCKESRTRWLGFKFGIHHLLAYLCELKLNN